MKIEKVLLLTLLVSFQTQAQTDSLFHIQASKSKTDLKRSLAIPALLIGTGMLATTDNDLIYREDFFEQRNKWMPRFNTHVDDYLQYAPLAGVIALNVAGIKGKHSVLNQAALLIKSELLMTAIVYPLKKISAVPRPDTHILNSFPSGHTAQAFVAATFLHKEYGKDRPMLSVLAYSTATGIGLLRVMNNRHWISDVLVGAGIGILSTNLVYRTHQNKWNRKHKQFAGVFLLPSYAQRTFSLSAVIPVSH